MTDTISGAFSGRLAKIQVTSPDVELRHYISDEELDLLCETKAGSAKDICLVALGAFLGSCIPAAEQLVRFNDAKNPMGIIGLISCLLATGTLAATLVAAFVWRGQMRQQTPIQTRIRSRPKYEVI